jgi:protein SCO1/2
MKRILFVIFLAFAITPAFGANDNTALRSGEFSPPRMAPDFSLRGSDGSELKLSRYRGKDGKVVALGFGYSSCPEVCPTTLAELASVKKKLGAEGKDFQVIYVTVDPERDTVDRLKAFVGGFDPSFIGATGSPAQLAEVRKAYGISATKIKTGDGGGYVLNHSSFVYLIDREGKLRALSPYGRAVDDVVHDVRVLLKK